MCVSSGSNEFTPVSKIGKLFLMIYAAIGIPLTLVFLSDLSLLITRLIKYLSLILLSAYSTNYFRHVRQWTFFQFIEKQLNISIPIPTNDDDLYSSTVRSAPSSPTTDRSFHEHDEDHVRQSRQSRPLSQHYHIVRLRKICNILISTLKDINDNVDLTMPQLIVTLSVYILIGACLLTSNSYFDSIYICFTSLFSIGLRNYYRNATANDRYGTNHLFLVAIYLLFGLAIVSLCIRAVQIRIQVTLENIGKKLLRDLVEFLRQMGKWAIERAMRMRMNVLSLERRRLP